jgi:hypothetical protein
MVPPPIYGDGYTFRCLTPDCINGLGAGRLYRTEEQAAEAWITREGEVAAVAAERARIEAAIKRLQDQFAFEGSQEIYDPIDSPSPKWYEGADAAFEEAITIVRGNET